MYFKNDILLACCTNTKKIDDWDYLSTRNQVVARLRLQASEENDSEYFEGDGDDDLMICFV